MQLYKPGTTLPWSKALTTMARAQIWLLTILNAIVAVWALFWLLKTVPATRNLVPQGISFWWIFAVFLGVPVGIILVTALGWGKARPGSCAKRAYFRISYAVLILGWIWVSPAAWFWVQFYVEIYEPWPISLRQGPDTDRAKEGFERTLGFAPPESVTSIYYRSISLRDYTDFLRFDFADPEVIDRIAGRFDLIQVPEGELGDQRPSNIRVRRSFSSWWIAEEINAADLIYVDRDTYDRMSGNLSRSVDTGRIIWIYQEEGKAFYKENGF